MNIPWWGYVILAGLCWGTYVPIIFYGGSELGGKPNARFMAILCVGGAYFVIGVLFPMILFLSGQQEWPKWSTTGIVFASLAGVAGALGAICVILATQAAMGEARAAGLAPATFKIYIAPLIFGLAPIINTLVASVWHPKPGAPFHFDVELPGWKLLLGIIFVGIGAFLVLFSKEQAEVKPAAPVTTIPAPSDSATA